MNSCAACVVLLLLGVANAQPADHRIRELAGSWVVYYARAYRIPVELVEAIIDEESGWNPFAVSSKGAVGIMQLMPGTAIRFGVRNRFRLDENIHGGVAYLWEVETMYREFAEKAASAGDKDAAGRFQEIRRDEMRHRDRFQAALRSLDKMSAAGK